MTVTLKPEQEQVLKDAIQQGLADNPDQALDRAFDALRQSLPSSQEDRAAAIDRLATFGKRHNLSLGGTIKDLLRESRQ